MKNWKLLVNTLILLLVPTIILASNLLIHDDFNAVSTWSYGANWYDSGIWGNKWTLVSGGHNGSYCAQSQQTTNTIISGSSMFAFVTPIKASGDKVFLRYWAKYPLTFDPRGNNHDPSGKAMYGYNTQRWYSGTLTKTVAEYGAIPQNFSGTIYANFYSYGDVGRHPSDLIIRDNQWHEYAWYIVQGSIGSANGTWACWIDGKGTYTQQNASAYYSNVKMEGLWQTLVFGNFFKGGALGNYTWWIDDIEVWDGMPSGTPSSSGGSTPIANAGANFTAIVGSTVTLDGSKSSDPDGNTITYSWTQTSGSQVSLSSTSRAMPTFVPTQAGAYTFALRVSDGTHTSSPASVTVTVQTKPVAAAVSLLSPANSTTVSTSPTLKWSGQGFNLYGVHTSINNGATWSFIYSGTNTSCGMSATWGAIKSGTTIMWYVNGQTPTGQVVKSSTGKFIKK